MPGNELPPLYAAVSYISSELGKFVEDLRAELHPSHAHLPAHISVLPPRPSVTSEDEAVKLVETVCSQVEAFEVELGDVETFIPTTPTVFIRVARAAYKMRELHDKLNVEALAYDEPLVFMPHLTIAKVDSIERAQEVYEISCQRWKEFQGSRTARIESVSFVRGRIESWIDLVTVPLTGVRR